MLVFRHWFSFDLQPISHQEFTKIWHRCWSTPCTENALMPSRVVAGCWMDRLVIHSACRPHVTICFLCYIKPIMFFFLLRPPPLHSQWFTPAIHARANRHPTGLPSSLPFSTTTRLHTIVVGKNWPKLFIKQSVLI